MTKIHTGPLQRTISRVFPNNRAATAIELIFLLLLGMIAIAIHSKLRIPMHLPGKQGIIFVVLIVTGRGLSRLPFASSITCLGSAMLLLTPWLGFHDPFIALTYILLGGVMDLIYGFTSKFSGKIWILAIASGLSWMFIPLFRLFLSLFITIPLNIFNSGFIYPFCTHLLFGFIGGLLGAGLLSLLNIRK